MTDIWKTGFGWICPNHKQVGCKIMYHLNEEILTALGNQEVLKFFLDTSKEVEDSRLSCEENLARGEHPEWHSYEMASDSLRFETAKMLYARGYVRVGYSGYRSILGFEGTQEAMDRLKTDIDIVYEECRELLDSRCKKEVYIRD